MTKNKKISKVDNLTEVESALTKTEQFLEKNQKIISIVIGSVVVIVGAYLALTKFHFEPQNKESQELMFVAQNYFEKDSFNLALIPNAENQRESKLPSFAKRG
jgi:hypothetical protein